jgi:hypothetical protein
MIPHSVNYNILLHKDFIGIKKQETKKFTKYGSFYIYKKLLLVIVEN